VSQHAQLRIERSDHGGAGAGAACPCFPRGSAGLFCPGGPRGWRGLCCPAYPQGKQWSRSPRNVGWALNPRWPRGTLRYVHTHYLRGTQGGIRCCFPPPNGEIGGDIALYPPLYPCGNRGYALQWCTHTLITRHTLARALAVSTEVTWHKFVIRSMILCARATCSVFPVSKTAQGAPPEGLRAALGSRKMARTWSFFGQTWPFFRC
jgi:hypothetical protein